MPCLVGCAALIGPRIALFVILLFEPNWVERAFNGWAVPVIGFLFLPWTTLAWIICYDPLIGISGFGWLIVAFAFIVDIGSYISAISSRNSRKAAQAPG